jgi:hypothetical protein
MAVEATGLPLIAHSVTVASQVNNQRAARVTTARAMKSGEINFVKRGTAYPIFAVF